MKKILAVFLVMIFFLNPAAMAGEYKDLMRRELARGFKNIIGFPLEIPITIQEYHEQAGWPFVRQMVGLVDGAFQGIVRLGSGLVDLPAAFIPHLQQGLPVKPETLF